MVDPTPYLTIHKKLVAAVQTPDKYASDWKAVAEALPKLVRDDGFNYLQGPVPDSIRRRLAGAKSLSKAIRAAAKAEGGLLSKPSNNARARALLIKTLATSIFTRAVASARSGSCPAPRHSPVTPSNLRPSPTRWSIRC